MSNPSDRDRPTPPELETTSDTEAEGWSTEEFGGSARYTQPQAAPDTAPTRQEELRDQGLPPQPGRTSQVGVEASSELSSQAGVTQRLPEHFPGGIKAGGSPQMASPAVSAHPLQARAEAFEKRPRQPEALRGPEGARGAAEQPKERRLMKWFKRGFIALIVCALLGVLGVVLVIEYYSRDLPSVTDLRKGYDPPQVTKILARDGSELASLFTERRTVIGLDRVPDHVKLAFLAAEDAHFYEHEGLNYLGMLRALAANLRAGKTVQGGSTITQQVIKNLLLDSSRSYERKMRETILARRLEQHLSKDEIFSLYLNHIYLGHGRYGVEEAARFYFGKPTKELNLTEAVSLAGLVASPERFSPRKNPEKNAERRRYVLGQMLQKQFINAELHEAALSAALHTAPSADSESELSPEAVAQVKQILAVVAGPRARRGGYTVKTTIDPQLQVAARKSVRESLDNYMKRQKLAPPYTLEKRRLWGEPFKGTPKLNRIYTGVVSALNDQERTIDVRVGDMLGEIKLDKETRYNAQRLPPSGFSKVGALLRVRVQAEPEAGGKAALELELGPQSALVAIDPNTRNVLALVGGYDAISGGLDRATRALRQPASAFKPFVYSYALHSRHFTPASRLALPQLPGGKSEGAGEERSLLLREAMAKSDNDAARLIFRQAGPANIVEWAKALGIQSEVKPDLSAALGAYEVTPIELANAYATFASGGEVAPWNLVTEIIDPSGKSLPLPPKTPKRRVMEPEEAYLITSLMTSVVRDGTGKRALALGRPVAGKTGTSNQARDTWFAGYSTEIVAAVWTGYDDNAPLGWGEQGAVSALPAWVSFMQAAHQKRPKTQFVRPPGIVVVQIDPRSGKLAYPGQEGAIDEEFLAGALPTETEEFDAGAEASVASEEDGGLAAIEEPGEEDASAAEPRPVGTNQFPEESTPPSGRDAGALLPEPDAGSLLDELPPF